MIKVNLEIVSLVIKFKVTDVEICMSKSYNFDTIYYKSLIKIKNSTTFYFDLL